MLTRRTTQFGELARRTEALLAQHGVDLASERVDALLLQRIRRVGELLGVSDRTALRYAPDGLPEMVVADVVEVITSPESRAADAADETRPGPKQRHLRIVE
jgi:hypothetical protein